MRPLSPCPDVFDGRASRVIGRCEIALMEGPDLIRCECANDGVEDTTVVEQDEIIFAPREATC